MKRLLVAVLLISGAALGQQVITPAGTTAKNAQAVQGVTGGVPIAISGSISSAGAADTIGLNAVFNANAVCGQVPVAGQSGAGFFLGAGTLVGTLAPSTSKDNANWTASSFVDSNGNTTASQAFTNPNAFFQAGILLQAGDRYARVCTTAWTSGTATGFALATTAQPRPPASGADVTDRAGRLLGIVSSITSPVAITAASLPLPAGAATSALQTTLSGQLPAALDGSGFLKAHEQGTAAVSAASLPLPAGAATSALQTTLSGQLPTVLDGSGFLKAHEQGTAAISAASLPLPSGAATEAGHLATIDTSTARLPAQGQALAAASLPVVLTAIQQAALTPPAAITGFALEAGHAASVDTKTPALGQALAASSVPVVLTAAQQTALTPPAAISGFALEAGHLASLDTKLPSQGQALAAASVPVVLTALQQTALTPPAAISGFALEAGHLATIDTSTAKIPAQGQALAAASLPVVLTAAQMTTLTPPATVTVIQGTGTNLHTVCDSGCGGAAAFSDNGVFTAGTTSVGVMAGVFNDSIAALTTGSAGAPRLTSTRAIHFNMRTNAGVEVPFPAALDADLGFKVHVQNALAVSWASAQHVIVDATSTTAVTQATGTNLHAVLDATSTTAVTQATGTNLHAVLDTTSTTAVTQATGTNLHAVIDTGSTTAATQATAANLNATVVGNVTPATAFANPTTAVPASALLSGFNGTTWDRLVSAGNNNDAEAVATTGVLDVEAHEMVFNGTSWDRRRGSTAGANVVGAAAEGAAVAGNPVWVAYKGFNGVAVSPRICDKKAQITTLGTTATVQQIAAVAGQQIYICGYFILASTATTATTLKWTEGTGVNCVTGQSNVTPTIFTTPIAAPTTANWTLGPFGPPALPWATVASDALCITQTVATNSSALSGVIFYTQN